jgi:hypothetical protein
VGHKKYKKRIFFQIAIGSQHEVAKSRYDIIEKNVAEAKIKGERVYFVFVIHRMHLQTFRINYIGYTPNTDVEVKIVPFDPE